MSADRFLEHLSLATLQAGSVARRLQGLVPNQPKEGRTPESRALTPADLACQDILLHCLRRVLPEAAVDCEEAAPELEPDFPPEEEGRALAVLDPIDGTLNYVEGSSHYAIMAAWCEAGRYEASVVSFPALGRTFLARTGRGVRELGGEPGLFLPSVDAPPVVTVTRGVPDEAARRLGLAGFEVVRTRCSALDGAGPLLGHSQGAVNQGRPGRRRAAAYLLTLCAGGVVRVAGADWDARDPRRLEPGGPTVLARDLETAERIEACLEGGSA